MTDLTKMSYTYDAAWAAMCMWEEVCAPQSHESPTPWKNMLDQHGTAEVRTMVLGLGQACSDAFEKAYAFYEQAYRTWGTRRQQCEVEGTPFLDEQPQEPGSFDWEFVPTWMRIGVDWSDVHNGPRVLGVPK